MKKIFLIIQVLINSGIAFGQKYQPIALSYNTVYEKEYVSAERTHQDSTGFYLIHFEYDSRFCTIPMTNPPGQPHYSAEITVYKIMDGKKQMIGEPFPGEYTPNGCFEDDPVYLIQEAKGQNRKALSDDN